MFGKTFKHVDALPEASEGIHEVMITAAKENRVKDLDCLDVYITYENMQKMTPRFIRFFDCTSDSTEDQKEAFNYKMSAFCGAFGVEERFDPVGLQSWLGHVGKVKIERDKNGYLTIGKFVPKDDDPEIF